MSLADSCLFELVKYVFEQASGPLTGITYQDLAGRIDRLNKHGDGHGHGMGRLLGEMGHLLQNMEGDWGEPIPHIQSLVVNKTGLLKNLPDDGIKEFWDGYPNLTRQEKQNKVNAEYVQIKQFGSRWNKVLSELELSIIKQDEGQKTQSSKRHLKGGESPQHLALKEYVHANPELFGADAGDERYMEYSLPSLDVVDVLFKNSTRWLAVEVKSRISDHIEQDYERGLYQCVKYLAILEAMKRDDSYKVPQDVQVVLLLETILPKKYVKTAKTLGLKVIANVVVPERMHE